MAIIQQILELPDGTLTNGLDKNTKLSVNYKPTTVWYDGTVMSSSKADGDLYTKNKSGTKFYRKVIDKDGELFLEKDTMAQMRVLTPREILYLKAGVYKGVKLSGLDFKGDTPASVDYYLSTTSSPDDGKNIILVGDIKLEHKSRIFYSSELTNALDQLDPKRPVFSKNNRTINIGSVGYPTIQSALNELPLMLKHNYRINVPDGDYSSEDIVIPSFHTTDINNEEGSAAHLTIIGNSASPESVKVGSILILATVGVSEPFIRGFTIAHRTPFIDEPYGIAALGTKGAQVYDIKFATTMNGYGIGAYEGSIKCKNIDITNTNRGFGVKRGGHIEIFDIYGYANNLFTSQGGTIYFENLYGSYNRLIQKGDLQYRTEITDGTKRKIITGKDLSGYNAREDIRLMMPLNKIINGITPELSGYQLDGVAQGSELPTVINNFIKLENVKQQLVTVKNHLRLDIKDKFFIAVKVKYNEVSNWAIGKDLAYTIRHRNSQIQCLLWNTDGEAISAAAAFTPTIGQTYSIIGYYNGNEIRIIVEEYVQNRVESINQTIATSVKDFVINGVFNSSNVLSYNGNIEVSDLILYPNVPDYMFHGSGKFNSDYAPMSVSPYNPSLYSPVEISKINNTTVSIDTSTKQPSSWMEVKVYGVVKYLPLYDE